MKKHANQHQSLLLLFGQRVRQLRQERKLSQEKLAELCNLDRSYLGCVERGEENISLISIAKIAVALDVPVRTLFEY